MKRQSRSDQVQGAGFKQQTAHAVLQEDMGESEDIPMDEEPDYGNRQANYSPELEYYEPDAFNQPDDRPEIFHIQDHGGHECRYCGNHFPSNNKLHNYLRGSCKGPRDSSATQAQDHETFASALPPVQQMFPKTWKKIFHSPLQLLTYLLSIHPWVLRKT